MSALPEELFANPVWQALATCHSSFALRHGAGACRYPADVTPFAAVSSPTPEALHELKLLMVPGESVWLVGEEYPSVDGLEFNNTLECFQMVLPSHVKAQVAQAEIIPLTSAHAGEMVALTDLAFPGFFRSRTCEMGSYYGVRHAGKLIAMGGERLVLSGYPEISAVCVHPSHRGQGLATSLIWHIVANHRRSGFTSWLHVGCANHNAVRLYQDLGFEKDRTVVLRRLTRQG